MNRTKIFFLFLFVFVALSIAYDNVYIPKLISGTYVYPFPMAIAEGPNQGDHLTLKEDGTFESDTWGNGTYTIKGSELSLRYSNTIGKVGFQSSLYRPFFWGSPRIAVFRDLNYYFEKTE